MRKRSLDILNDQAAAGVVVEQLQQKLAEQAFQVDQIVQDTTSQIQRAHQALSSANEYIEKCRDFVSPANLEHILGPEGTKHGEIAETLEVNFRNGRDVLKNLSAKSWVLDQGADRIGPSDYVIDVGTPVQSKFANGGNGEIVTPNNSLRHILEHLKKYPGYANDTTAYGFPGQHGIYHMPKDQYDILLRIKDGNLDGISYRTIKSAKDFIAQIEAESGKNFYDVVKPGLNSYSEVQLGRVDDTINQEARRYEEIHEGEVKTIRKERDTKLDEAQHITDASWADAFKAAGIAAAISGVTSAGIKIYTKIRSGKKLGEFELDDWKDVGYDFVKGGFRGGISGASIYGLTKLGGFSAPFAGGLTTSAIGITSLYIDYKKGIIDDNDFAASANSLCIESGLAAVGAAIGQAIIPIPIIGGVVGTISMQVAVRITKQVVGEKEAELLAKMEAEYQTMINGIDAQVKTQISIINAYYERLGGLIEGSMDFYTNHKLRVEYSIKLAEMVGVQEILHNQPELDNYMSC